MDWHARYTSQAGWTRALRDYLFEKAGMKTARRVLEVGCGTGAVLGQLSGPRLLYGLDIDMRALRECGVHAPAAQRVCGDALRLPHPAGTFDIVYCHFLLLWVPEPLQAVGEMKRVVRPGGHVLALAEPEYSARLDEPPELAPLGRWQAEALAGQGADPGFGARLADTFYRAGLHIVETGMIKGRGVAPLSAEERQLEWQVLESDLAGHVPAGELLRMKALERAAWERGTRRLEVPTYFAWGTV